MMMTRLRRRRRSTRSHLLDVPVWSMLGWMKMKMIATEYAGLDEDENDREQRLIKNVDENSMKTIHAIARDVAREVARGMR